MGVFVCLFQYAFPIIVENNTGRTVFHPCHQRPRCLYQYLSLRCGDMKDTHVLSTVFLPSMLMLIFIQTVPLSKLPHFIYMPSITSSRYNTIHSCASITVLFLSFLEDLCLLHFLFQTFPTVFHSFPMFHCTSFSVISFFFFYVLQYKLKFFLLIDPVLCSCLYSKIQMHLVQTRVEKETEVYVIQELKGYFGLMIQPELYGISSPFYILLPSYRSLFVTVCIFKSSLAITSCYLLTELSFSHTSLLGHGSPVNCMILTCVTFFSTPP